MAKKRAVTIDERGRYWELRVIHLDENGKNPSLVPLDPGLWILQRSVLVYDPSARVPLTRIEELRRYLLWFVLGAALTVVLQQASRALL